ncbi:MAG TPA: hypothetical protein VL068_03260 [Microthrixaceae bacterium]|nr:hypothetical protein [Microthrixaceae bacterium]
MAQHSYYALVGPAHVLTPPGNPASVALARVQRVVGGVYASLSARPLR